MEITNVLMLIKYINHIKESVDLTQNKRGNNDNILADLHRYINKNHSYISETLENLYQENKD